MFGVQASKSPETEANRSITAPELPKWKWETVSMDFIGGLLRTVKGHTMIWVIIDRPTKTTHFISRKPTFSVSKWAKMYMKEVVRLHRVSVSIVFNREMCFTSKFWKSPVSFRHSIGFQYNFSTHKLMAKQSV